MPLLRWVGRAIGLDVHRDFCVVAICEDGVVRSAGRVPSTPEGLRTLAESLLVTDRVALEVTGSCWEVARILEPLCEPGDRRLARTTPGSRNARAKTDKLDARALASLLWKGELEAVWMPDERCRILRRRLARREQLVHSRSRSKNEIHAVLQRRLQGKPPCSDLFGVKGRQWLAGLELPPEERESVDAGIRHVEFLDTEIAAVERLIAQQALSWPEIRRLMTVPGVNLICAASFIAAVGDPNRFMTSRQTRRLSRPGPEGPPVRRGAGPQRPDLKARIAIRPVGAGRGRVDRGQPARAAARLLSANPSTPRARQGDRRDRPQARGPVLVHAHPLTGLRPPATLADPQEAPPPGDHRRRAQIHAPCRWDLVNQRPDARPPSSSSPGKPRPPTSAWSKTSRPEPRREKWARARHRSAHKLGPRRA